MRARACARVRVHVYVCFRNTGEYVWFVVVVVAAAVVVVL